MMIINLPTETNVSATAAGIGNTVRTKAVIRKPKTNQGKILTNE